MSISDLSSGALYREDERAYQEDILSKSHFLGEYVLTTWQPIAALHAFIRTGRAFRFRKWRRVSIALWRIPTMRTPDMTTICCTVIIRLAPSSAIINLAVTVLSKSTSLSPPLTNRSWCGSLTITLILRHLIEKYTPRTSSISQSEDRDGKFEFMVRPRICNTNYINTTAKARGASENFFASRSAIPAWSALSF